MCLQGHERSLLSSTLPPPVPPPSRPPPPPSRPDNNLAAKKLPPPIGACVGTAGKFAATGSSFMDGADDVAVLEVGNVQDAAESCCSMCAEREGCVGWDTYRESAGSYLCQVMRWAAGGLTGP